MSKKSKFKLTKTQMGLIVVAIFYAIVLIMHYNEDIELISPYGGNFILETADKLPQNSQINQQ